MMEKLIKYLAKEDFDKLLKAEKDKEYKLIYSFGFCSGLRISEIIGYKLKGIWRIKPLESNQIDLITHQIKIIGGKGLKDRITVIPPNLTEEHLKLLPLKIPRRTVQYHFSKLAMKVLNKKMSIHTLRHGFGNYMVNEKNVPMPMVQQLMGHSRIDTTGLYSKANPKKSIEKAWDSF